jgi:hypothetical protein
MQNNSENFPPTTPKVGFLKKNISRHQGRRNIVYIFFPQSALSSRYTAYLSSLRIWEKRYTVHQDDKEYLFDLVRDKLFGI